MLTNKVTDKNSIKLIDSSEKVCCEIVCDDNICTLKLFNQNIPSDYRGENNIDTFNRRFPAQILTRHLPVKMQWHHLSSTDTANRAIGTWAWIWRTLLEFFRMK